MLPVDPLYWGASPSPCWYLPDQSFSKPFYRKLAFARMIVVPCKTAVHTKRVQSLTGNSAPLFPKNNKNRSLENFAQTFLPFPAFLFPAVWWNWTRICGAPVTLIGIHVHINIYIQGGFFYWSVLKNDLESDYM